MGRSCEAQPDQADRGNGIDMAPADALVGKETERGVRRGPSRQIPSSPAVISSRASASLTTLNIGVPSSPAFQRQRLLVKVNEEGTSRP